MRALGDRWDGHGNGPHLRHGDCLNLVACTVRALFQFLGRWMNID
jgi:hypothetical protein